MCILLCAFTIQVYNDQDALGTIGARDGCLTGDDLTRGTMSLLGAFLGSL
jgi:hypothetical protein